MSNRKEYFNQRYLKNKGKMGECSKQYYQDNKEFCKECVKRWKENHPGYWGKHKYNLSYEDWLKMWEAQEGKCIICGESFKNPSEACIDHDHQTNKIRGLLCRKCNSGIGFFKDNPIITARATEYLLGE